METNTKQSRLSLTRLMKRTKKGLRFFMIQFAILLFVDVFYFMSGNPEDIQDLSIRFNLLFFVLSYTMIFCWYYVFIPVRYRLKTVFLPYSFYVLLVFMVVAFQEDWMMRNVFSSRLLLISSLAPFCGLLLLILKSGFKMFLSRSPFLLRLARALENGLVVACILPVFYLFILPLFFLLFS